VVPDLASLHPGDGRGENIMQPHKIVSYEEWLAARKAHLKNEKALTRMRDLVAAERRSLPWVKVEKRYLFDTTAGKKTLADLFGRNSQLIVHHFMWRHDLDSGCPSCSLEADHAEGALVHLVNHDVGYVRVSRAPLEKLTAYRKRLGWSAEWVSSWESDFNYDFHVSFTPEDVAKGEVNYNFEAWSSPYEELPGISAFYKNDAGDVFHTYSTYGRGVEVMMGTYAMLDLMPKGRDERDVAHKMEWVRHHDRY
jgi:predicted dithiol-disulfide oxidoreductase (DUF899 family)